MTLLPELERELVSAAGRLGRTRGRLSAARRLALPVAALAVIAVVIGVIARGSGEEPATDRPALDQAPPQRPSVRAVPGTASPRATATVEGVTYEAFGYLSARGLICIRFLEPGDDPRRPSVGCLNTRGAREALAERPAHIFAGGGSRSGVSVATGLARPDVTAVRAVNGARVVLSRSWRPTREVDPIRFFLVFTRRAGKPQPGQPLGPRLQVRLGNGPFTDVGCLGSAIRPTNPPRCSS